MPIALLSVSDKSGLVSFAQSLRALGWQLLASGGSAQALRQAGLPVQEVAAYTDSPEILGGRVKTLHPAIHGGILAQGTPEAQAELQALGWDYIDLVAVNLYPFEQTIAKSDVTLAEAIENIDIGGVALIRAAAKNHARVTVVCEPADYVAVLNELQQTGTCSPQTRQALAVKGFAHTAHYDAAIQRYLAQAAGQPATLQLTAQPVQTLRYGENPHQTATLYSWQPNAGPLGGTLLQGKALSYNNILDLDAAWQSVVRFAEPTVVIVKHLSPCGIASATSLAAAFPAALASDPISAFGGVIALNRSLDAATVQAFGDLFIECIAAPAFETDALSLLAKRKNCRLIEIPNLQIEPRWEVRSVTAGILQQSLDLGDPTTATWQVVSQRQPTPAEWEALRFAWLACQTVRSNAIVLAQGTATVGIGGGQPNRVDCVRIAAQKAGSKTLGAVLASDAFFPFPDSLQVAAAEGVTAAIHPGGSMRDSESIAAADAANMALVVTGVRHFRH